jgi:peptidoglycan/xylan/chitin deacetylase (PgdA/CDA1 family)
MSRPVAVISVDVESVDDHLVGYGIRSLPHDPLVHERALPRLLDMFSRTGIRATLFVVGRDAETHAAILGEAAGAGHEIASHTWSHPIGFASLPPERQRAELEDSRRALEHASGSPVVGFRAPHFDLDARAVPRLVAAGYRYDASGYPSPMLLLARALLALKSAGRGDMPAMSLPFTWRRDPHDWHAGGATIREFPLAVTPGLRMPVYHTLRYYTSEVSWNSRLEGFARRGEMLSYALHGVDALGLAEDRVNDRLARHPGMNRPLEDKLGLLEATLRTIASRFEPRPFRELLD